jgi:methylated-DNA-protein-cysteine methyltransferase-like protein
MPSKGGGGRKRSRPKAPAPAAFGAPSFYQACWEVVREVPPGKVVTYGQVATWLDSPRSARAVGYAMFNVDTRAHPGVPWHRVINAKGEISVGGNIHRPDVQRKMLEAEGVTFDEQGRVDLRRVRWEGAAVEKTRWRGR